MKTCDPWPRALLLLALLLTTAASPGCFYVGGKASLGPSFDEALVARIVPGQSDKTDVLGLLGPPSEFMKPELAVALLDDSSRFHGALEVARRAADVWTWQRDTLDGDGTLLLLFSWVEFAVDSEVVVIFFDEDGTVSHVAQGAGRSALEQQS